MAKRHTSHAAGTSRPDPSDANFLVVAGLPIQTSNLHITFVNGTGVVSTFGRDNMEHLQSWWALQCAKLQAQPKFWLMMNVREFTPLRDLKTGLPIKKLSSCVFRHGQPAERLSAASLQQAFGTDSNTGQALPPRTDIVYVDFPA